MILAFKFSENMTLIPGNFFSFISSQCLHSHHQHMIFGHWKAVTTIFLTLSYRTLWKKNFMYEIFFMNFWFMILCLVFIH